MNTTCPPLRAGLLALATFATFATAAAGRDGWTTDFEAAKTQAAAEKKDLMLDFTGSDWCGWCIKLDKEVFQQDAFKTGVKDKLVLVELDYPKDKSKQSAATKTQNEKLGGQFKVQGYPTILLCDASGKPYAKTGYKKDGPESYVTHLEELMAVRVKRDAAFAAAEQATDNLAKAQSLVAGLKTMDPEIVSAHYADVIARIGDLDKDDSTGFGKEQGAANAEEEAAKGVQAFMQTNIMPLMQAKEFDKAYAAVQEHIKANPSLPEALQVDLTLNIGLARFVEKGDLDAATKFVDEVIAKFPKQKIAEHRDPILKQITLRIQQLKTQSEGAPAPAAPKPE
jgi:thioredoxin-related protein